MKVVKPSRPATRDGRHTIVRQTLPVYTSMVEMSGALGIPIDILKRSKRTGSNAFLPGGRIDCAEWIRWFFDEGIEDNADWARRCKRADALMKEIDLDKMRRELHLVDDIREYATTLVRTFFWVELDRMAQEFPVTLKGKGEVDINAEVSARVKKIKENQTKFMDEWEKKNREATK